METIENLLNKLNEEQIKPVLDTEGKVLVIAGAGSGKTRVLTTRIAYLVLEKGVNPYNILAITFTNKAAEEMKERLKNFIGANDGIWVSTIHSMCVKILRQNIDRIGYDKNFTIYDETDKDKALKFVINELGLDVDKLLKPFKNLISQAKNDCLTPDEFYKENAEMRNIDEFISVYNSYENYLSRTNSLDFDDLLFRTYELFNKCPEVANSYAEKFRYVHIDEFQDTNTVQFYLARKLSEVHGNLFVVGDDDQSIYSWRGAKIENILDFDKIYPDAKVYKLERNYRSTKNILDLANRIIKNNTGRREKTLWTDNSDGCRVETFVGTDENNEATFTVMQIKNLMARDNNLHYRDFAVFMRVNAISRAFEQEFTKYGIPYKVFGGFRFFERKEIKDVLSYLKVVNNNFDDESFIRAVATPKRGIGDKTLSELREYATSKGMCVYQVIDFLADSTISSGAKQRLVNFKNLLNDFKDFSDKNSISETIRYVLKQTSFLDQFAEKNEENDSKKMNIDELINTAELFEKENAGSVLLSDFLNSVTLSSDTDELGGSDCVTVATIHAAKGLEYKNVFVSGLDEGILPVSRVDLEDIEEERRLMYVAVTRGMERVYLTRASSRFLYGSRNTTVPSRFLKEAKLSMNENAAEKTSFYNDKYGVKSYNDKGLFGGESGGTVGSSEFQGGYSSDYAKNFLNNNKPKENKGVEYSKYKIGIKVKHAKFGVGTVVNVKGSGENLICDVAFMGLGIKSLSIKYAPLEIL